MSPVAKKSIGMTSFDKRNQGSVAGLPPKSPSHSQTRPVQSPFSNKKSILKSQTKGSPYSKSKSPRAAGSDNVGGNGQKKSGRSSKRGSLDRGSHDNEQKQGPSNDALLSRGSGAGGVDSGENALRPRI